MPSIWKRASVVLILVAAWFLFAPTSVGGRMDYVTVQGHSMEPTFHTSDLVLITRHRSYRVGEIIAYSAASMGGATVIHRIIGMADGRYITKGDNNDFVDQYRPSNADVRGSKQLLIRSGASLVDQLHSRSVFMGLLGATVLSVLVSARPTSFRRRRRNLRGHRA